MRRLSALLTLLCCFISFTYVTFAPVSLDSLKLFKDIAGSKSVSRGAALNQMSQSAASQYLQELERNLDTVLLDRSTRPLTITAGGKLYLDMCRDVLRRQEDFRAALDRLKIEVEGTVRVAAIYSIGISEMSELELEFSRRFPDARLEVKYLRPEKVYASVLGDEVDLGLVSYPEATREIEVIFWRKEEMVLAASPYHPLASKASVTPEELNGVEFVGFDEDLPIRREIDNFLEERGVDVRVTFQFDNLQMIKEAVAMRAGVSIMPARIMQSEIAQGRLVAVKIAGPELYRPLGIIFRRKKRFHRVAQAFLDLLQEKPQVETILLSPPA